MDDKVTVKCVFNRHQSCFKQNEGLPRHVCWAPAKQSVRDYLGRPMVVRSGVD